VIRLSELQILFRFDKKRKCWAFYIGQHFSACYAFYLAIEVAILPNMKKKNINTRKEQEKKAQREKEAAKKAMTSQLPSKGKKK
jgi:hypothetical protein